MSKNPSLSVGRKEKLSVKEGAGLTKKGRDKYNKETGSHLKAPAPHPKSKADEGRKKSFLCKNEGRGCSFKRRCSSRKGIAKTLELRLGGYYAETSRAIGTEANQSSL